MKKCINMRRQTTLKAVTILLLSIYNLNSYSQTNQGQKQQLYNSIGQTEACVTSTLSIPFTTTTGQSITLALTGAFTFTGTVVNNVRKYENLQTVTVRSSASDASMLLISKITNEDGSFTYRGTILNTAYADCLEIKEGSKGEYMLVKKETKKVLEHCNIKIAGK